MIGSTITSSWDPDERPRRPDDLHPVLRDRHRDRRLRTDGFVTFPLLDDHQIDDLRAVFEALHGWNGSGFEADLMNPDFAYRAKVSEALAQRLDELVSARFVDHVPFLRNFLCKWPDEDSALYLHQDWMYVDERSGSSSYVAWIALSDVTGHEGQLRVLRGSHLLDRSLRGTDLTAAWADEHQDAIEERLQSLPVRRGDCVVLSNALLHSSYPNHTTSPRLVAALGMVPDGEPLAYFRRSGPSEAVRYEVDPDFFGRITPAALHEQAPPLEPIERIEIDPPRWTADQLIDQLDQVQARAGALERAMLRLGAPVRR